jgi:hypothetical protein
MDSTANLVWADTSYVELPLQRLPAGQPDVQENDPVSRHRKFEMGLVLARPDFRRFLKHRGHARVRHVCFDGDAGSRNRPCGGIGQSEDDRNRTDLGRFGRDRVLNRDRRRPAVGPGTPGHEPSGDAGEQQNA